MDAPSASRHSLRTSPKCHCKPRTKQKNGKLKRLKYGTSSKVQRRITNDPPFDHERDRVEKVGVDVGGGVVDELVFEQLTEEDDRL